LSNRAAGRCACGWARSPLADDLALALAVQRIRIQAPVPGRGYVGIEVPNDEMALVALREVVESEVFTRNKSRCALRSARMWPGTPRPPTWIPCRTC
jgi:S-DNA-T family DNA segregation ATPase FtsK/SpoIIIE